MTENTARVSLNRVLGILSAGVIAISCAAILIRWCDAPPLTIAFYRLCFASLFFWITSNAASRAALRQLSLTQLRWGWLAGIALALHFATWITSLNHTSVTNSVVLVSTVPIFVALGARLILGEKAHALLYWGLALAFVGVTLITLQESAGGPNSLWGNLLAVAGALFAGIYFLIGRKLRRQIDTAPYVMLCYASAALLLLLAAWSTRSPLTGYSWQTYATFLGIALIPQVIGHTSFNWALKHLSAPTVSIAMLSEPIGASLLAVLFLEEKISAMTMLGGSLTLIGVSLAIFSERGKS